MVQLKLISDEAPALCKSNQSLFKVKKTTTAITEHSYMYYIPRCLRKSGMTADWLYARDYSAEKNNGYEIIMKY